MTLRRFSVHFTLAVALVLVGGAASCSDDDGEDGSPDPTTTQPTTTLTQAQEDEQALRQLAEDWYAQLSAIYDNGADPETAQEYITGGYYDTFVAEVEAFRETGQTTEVSPASRQIVESVTVNGNEATLDECFVDADVLYDADGQVANDDVVTTRFATDAVKTDDGCRFERRVPTGANEEGDQCPS